MRPGILNVPSMPSPCLLVFALRPLHVLGLHVVEAVALADVLAAVFVERPSLGPKLQNIRSRVQPMLGVAASVSYDCGRPHPLEDVLFRHLRRLCPQACRRRRLRRRRRWRRWRRACSRRRLRRRRRWRRLRPRDCSRWLRRRPRWRRLRRLRRPWLWRSPRRRHPRLRHVPRRRPRRLVRRPDGILRPRPIGGRRRPWLGDRQGLRLRP